MKVLVLCSTTGGGITPFVKEQVESCAKESGFHFEYAEIKNKGAIGYLQGYFTFLKKLLSGKYDLVHAHYGLSALLACLQPFKPAVVTFHGCDVNDPKTRWISKLAYKLCRHAIFVEAEMPTKLNATKKYSVIPCGVDTNIFYPIAKTEARKKFNFNNDQKIALFASAFDVPVKNAELAKKTCEQTPGLQLIELKNRSREEVNLLLNAVDLLILTSIREGSPQIIKEALATNCPIVSTNVGDISMRIKGVSNTFVCDANPNELSIKIKQILTDGTRSNGRDRIFEQELDLMSIAKKINSIYSSIRS
jgi:teichuronic acid biosynthesis glycosyltransferase TuaC